MKEIELIKELGINLDDSQLEKLEKFYNLLVEKNKVMNLTGITEKHLVYLKHFYDSLTLIKAHDMTKQLKICDIGGGAGFPSIPLKIAYPNLDITVVDSLGKRITFLNQVIEELNLNNIRAVHQRAEEHAVSHRESYDIVTARAVARLSVLSELCIPLVKVGGYFTPLKAEINDELVNADKAISELGGKLEDKIEFLLPLENSARTILKIKKIKKSELKYPRSFGIIKKDRI